MIGHERLNCARDKLAQALVIGAQAVVPIKVRVDVGHTRVEHRVDTRDKVVARIFRQSGRLHGRLLHEGLDLLLVVILVVEHVCRGAECLPYQVFSRRELVGGLHLSEGTVRRSESADQDERRRNRGNDGSLEKGRSSSAG